ncbi:hypothetical protein GH714_027741 [Hevea brasiliensis]|uniref:DUF547 domain-containing protein n=1 Tax=Hevea brasiliensis TaxID=3981 RepID=A0A6A6MJ28_HEVBR|nr:hypothetical protein GH714_027741 [Hevea brasiliensis]
MRMMIELGNQRGTLPIMDAQTSVDCGREVRFRRSFRSLVECMVPCCGFQPSDSLSGDTDSIHASTVTGTFFGYRKGRVSFCLQDDTRCSPLLLLEFAVPTACLAREMQYGLLRIALECDRQRRGPALAPSSTYRCGPCTAMGGRVSDNEMLDNILNMSPNFSAYPNSIVKSENMLSCEASLNRNSKNTSSDALRKEIATLEAEILHLERYVLSLYRTAFEENLPAISNVPKNHLQCEKRSPSKVGANQSLFNLRSYIENSNFIYHDQTSPAHGWATSDDQSCTASIHSTSTADQKNADSGRRSLADHLGASCLVNSLNTPDVLSEYILKCISSIYCKLANCPKTHGGLSSSPPSSLSSSSMFSSHNPSDNSSPQHSEDAIVHRQGLKEDGGPYSGIVEVMKICFNDDSSNYAALMLKNFRSLVRSLEKVDPRKMKREEKLVFWINIHNALVMHAYLAYGTHNRVKGASILKASYNIGGHCVNACVIQNSILRILSHYSEPGHTLTLCSPWFEVDIFLLSSGSSLHSKEYLSGLKLAKEEFVQASVYIHKEAKIFLPKNPFFLCKGYVNGYVWAIEGNKWESYKSTTENWKVADVNAWLAGNVSFIWKLHGDIQAAIREDGSRGLLLEGDNYEFWVALGCLSRHNAMKQHALIRGLQLDVSSAVAWSYLRKLYREEGQKKLARQAFDCARSVDPSLALRGQEWQLKLMLGSPQQAGYAADAVQECENLKKVGGLMRRHTETYAFLLWQLGKSDLALYGEESGCQCQFNGANICSCFC